MRTVLVFALIAFAALAADQGKPGTQGAWPVAITSGGWTPDGGYLGTVRAVQGPGYDGGTAWNVSGSIGGSSSMWEQVEEFDLAAWLVTDGGFSGAKRINVGYPPDGGAFTWEFDGASSTSATELMVRPVDVSGRAMQVRAYIAGGTPGTLVVTLYQYGYMYPVEATQGATAIYTAAMFNASNASAMYAMGSGMNASPPFYPARPPAFGIRLTPNGTLSSATVAKIQLWRLP